MAAKEQALNTRLIEVGFYDTRRDPRRRLVQDAPESMQHITAGCKMLAGTEYFEHHDQVAA